MRSLRRDRRQRRAHELSRRAMHDLSGSAHRRGSDGRHRFRMSALSCDGAGECHAMPIVQRRRHAGFEGPLRMPGVYDSSHGPRHRRRRGERMRRMQRRVPSSRRARAMDRGPCGARAGRTRRQRPRTRRTRGAISNVPALRRDDESNELRASFGNHRRCMQAGRRLVRRWRTRSGDRFRADGSLRCSATPGSARACGSPRTGTRTSSRRRDSRGRAGTMGHQTRAIPARPMTCLQPMGGHFTLGPTS